MYGYNLIQKSQQFMYDRKEECFVEVLHLFLILPLTENRMCNMHRDQLPPATPSFQVQTPSADAIDYEKLVLRLCDLNEELLGQTTGVIERIEQEITHFTRGYLTIRWHQPGDAPPRFGPLLAVPSAPMLYGGHYYGELVTAVDPAQPAMPLVPLAKAQAVANICGWLIYSVEVAAFLGNQHVASREFAPLRPREREVLALMSRQYNEQAIADALHISLKTVQKHQENIYKRLGVHAAHHAILSGFLNAQFSPLASLTPRASNPYVEE